MKISITNKNLNDILLNDLEYSEEEIHGMDEAEKIDRFVGAGYF